MLDDRADVGLPVVTPEGSEPLGCGRYWAVAATHPQAETWAKQNLERAGYPVYLPTVEELRRDPVLRSMTRVVVRPLWPGYLLVDLRGGAWTPVRYCEGVRQLLMAGLRPHYLDAGVQSALEAGESLRRYGGSSPASLWAPGMACRVSVGGVETRGAVVSVRKGAARVAMVILGAIREVTIEINRLQAL